MQYSEAASKAAIYTYVNFTRQLTKSLLKRDFGIKLDLPDDRLCPPVCTTSLLP